MLRAAIKHHRRRGEIQEGLAGVKEIRVDVELWQFYQNFHIRRRIKTVLKVFLGGLIV